MERGNNENGQLGRGDIGEAYSATPQMLSVQANSQDVKFINVAAGKDFAFALTTSGSVYSWGTSSRGQLGNGATSNSNVPQNQLLRVQVQVVQLYLKMLSKLLPVIILRQY